MLLFNNTYPNRSPYFGRLLPILLFLLSGLLLCTITSSAQAPHPVSWSFFSRQVSPGVFEGHTIVTVQEGWRFRNQTPVDIAPQVGRFTFLQHPNVRAVGVLKSERTVIETPIKQPREIHPGMKAISAWCTWCS